MAKKITRAIRPLVKTARARAGPEDVGVEVAARRTRLVAGDSLGSGWG